MNKVVLTTLSGAMGGLAVGYNLGVVAPACLFLDSVYDDITTTTVSVRIANMFTSDVLEVRKLCIDGCWNRSDGCWDFS